jgi:hypothetical protein
MFMPGTSVYSREHVDRFEKHWHGTNWFDFHFLGARIRGYDAVQFLTCRRDANKDHARTTKKMCAPGTCGKRRKARTAPEMKQRRHTLPCGVRNSLQKQVGNDNFVADRTFRR